MQNLPIIQIEGDLKLREIDPNSELDYFYSIIVANKNFFQSVEFSGADVNSKEQALELLLKGESAKKEGTGARFGLWQGRELLGQFNVFELKKEHRKAQVGYWLSQKYSGKGYASKALSSLVKYAFKDLVLHRLEATTAITNQSSIRLLERIGFRREGLLREAFWTCGKFVDDYLYALLATDKVGI